MKLDSYIIYDSRKLYKRDAQGRDGGREYRRAAAAPKGRIH